VAVSTTPPYVRQVSQWDGTAHQAANCTCATTARMLLFGWGIVTSGGQVRAAQSDQIGGTSLPDVLRAMKNRWGKNADGWAAPNDGLPIPANKKGGWITTATLWNLLADPRTMVAVQGDYGDLPLAYREQATFRDDHTFSVDSVRDTPSRGKEAYVVDTIPRYSENYDGRWMPWNVLLAYAFGLAGQGRVYAFWVRTRQSAPTPPTEVPVYELTDSRWPYPVTVDNDTKVYDEDGNVTGEISAPSKPFMVIAENESGTRVWLHGAGQAPRTKLGLVDKSRVNRV